MKNENREQTVEEFIKSVDQTWIDSINNSIYPYTKIADKYQLKPELFYAYNEAGAAESVDIGDNDYGSYELANAAADTEYKIDIGVSKDDDVIDIEVAYNDQLYSENYIKTFLNSIETVLNQFVNGDIRTLRICDIELETTKELPTFIPLENPFVHKRFESQEPKI